MYRTLHDDVIKWKHFPRYWHFVSGTNRSPVDSPHKGLWRGPGDAELWCFISAWTNGWVNNLDAGDLRRHRANYNVTVMVITVTVMDFLWLYNQSLWIRVIGFSPIFRLVSQAPGQSQYCPSACEVNLKNMGKIDSYQTITNVTKQRPWAWYMGYTA